MIQSDLNEENNLSDSRIASGLSMLMPTPEGQTYAYSHLTLTNMVIKDISSLKTFIYIQVLDLSCNAIEDISCLGSMKYLCKLYLRNNRIQNVSHWTNIPLFLEVLDLSHNRLSSIEGISKHQYLEHLCVDNNLLSSLGDLSKCKNLVTLSARNNRISDLSSLSNLPITHLDLCYNALIYLTGIETLHKLQHLKLSNNKITSIIPLSADDQSNVELIDLSNNSIDALHELEILSKFLSLHSLYIHANPFLERILEANSKFEESTIAISNANGKKISSKQRKWVIYKLPQLDALDGFPLSVEECVDANDFFDPDVETIATHQHSIILQHQLKQYVTMEALARHSHEIYVPILVTGKRGSGKRAMCQMLVNKYPSLFESCIAYTSRPKLESEVDGVDYHFLSEQKIIEMLSTDKFLELIKYKSVLYGITLDCIEAVAKKGKICLLTMDIEGAVILKRSNIKTYTVFLLSPTDTASAQEYARSFLHSFDACLNNENVVKTYENFEAFALDVVSDITRNVAGTNLIK